MTREQVRQARQTNLVDFLRKRGEAFGRVGKEYHLKEHPSLYFRRNFFNWHSRNISGNSVDFCMYYYGMSFKDAVSELISSGCDTVSFVAWEDSEPRQVNPRDENVVYASDCRRVYGYLCKTRGINYSIVSDFVSCGLLRQDGRNNCFFRVLDFDKCFIGGEVHGTLSNVPFKQGYGHSSGFWFQSGRPEICCFFESAIDLMSFYQIHHCKCKNHLLVSMAGMNPDTVERFINQYPGVQFCLCIDNDIPGRTEANDFINRMLGRFPFINVYRPSVQFKDWNDCLMGKEMR